MPQVTLLGSAATLAGRDNDTIYLLVQSTAGPYLIDCGGSPPHKLARAGADLCELQGVLLTHDHTDHIYGLPLLVQALMLHLWAGEWSGRLNVWGLQETLATAAALLEALQLTDAIPIDWRPVEPEPNHLVLETADLRLLTTPVQHMRPTVGVRLESKRGGDALVYSSDTGPCPALHQLAAGAAVLLHEVAVKEPMGGHSTPAQAGQVAAAAGVERLVLVHFDPTMDEATMIAEAGKAFGGLVEIGRDWMTFHL